MPADLALVRRLAAAENGLATLAVARQDGTVHASVVNAGVLPDPVSGRDSVGLVARGGTRKLVHLRRSRHATIVFRRGWEWVSVQGTVRLIGPDDPDPDFLADGVPRLLRDVFTAAGGTHDDWAEYDRVMAEERRTAVFVTAERITGNP
ncbi:PPOX class probable F420-dependent enzyme [Prauserella shujinwangii]|uniref:PPOX class probable F420-dependent enzyme n=1 Tax=Prauserella shujinwangii TaxID=1453103 RepID=A0A2T0LU59_9PSEU|nr:pyridoxamine 5'-phosphate oxidase family protein [Prauserella shujinwangii]PRX47243.1 PPOX class probable F420-dependent enzyme [Prauserella shujinwangii]